MEVVEEMKKAIAAMECIRNLGVDDSLWGKALGHEQGVYDLSGEVLPCLKKAVAMLEGEG